MAVKIKKNSPTEDHLSMQNVYDQRKILYTEFAWPYNLYCNILVYPSYLKSMKEGLKVTYKI